MARVGGVAAFIVALAAAAVASAHAADLILPGKGIGQVQIGMTVQELYAAMGEPKATELRDDTTAYTFDGLQVGVENSDQIVYEVFATSPKFKLPKGSVSVGSSTLALVASYGEPYERGETSDGDKTFCYGDDFKAFVRSGSIIAILVNKGGCGTGFLYYLH